jgi:hypothetical protein
MNKRWKPRKNLVRFLPVLAFFVSPLTCATGTGSTLHTARCKVFKKLLCNHNGTFMQIHKGIEADFNDMFQTKVDMLVFELDKIFAQIQHDVDQVCSTNEDDSPEGKAMREELLAMLPAAREFLEEKVQKRLKQCKEMAE